MKQCFGSYGKVYRMGGDEFAVVLMVDKKRLKYIQRDFEETMNGQDDWYLISMWPVDMYTVRISIGHHG